MRRWDTIAIVGVGLIGASIGLALRQRKLVRRVVGVGRNRSRLARARRLGAVDETKTDVARGVVDAELVIVAAPVGSIVELARRAATDCPRGALITDVGSTKARIVRALGNSLREATFVGSHPLAGGEQSGCEHAREDLFEGRVAIVTPGSATPAAAVGRASGLWRSLGMRVVRMTPLEHDRALAATSHLPHLAASAVASATPQGYLSLTATGWRDVTRTAAGDPALWRDIFQANKENVLRALTRLEHSTAALRAALEADDALRLERLLARAKRTRDAVGN